MRVGAVDIGTNSVRLLVADVANGVVAPVQVEVRVTGLGVGLDASGALDAGAMERTVAILAGYRTIIAERGVRAVGAVATSASRDAGDVDAFLHRIERVLGVRPRVIDGEEEAALGFRGAATAVPDRPLLVIDPGGGSTEFVVGTAEPQRAVSIDMGSVRLTDRAGLGAPADPGAVAAAHEMAAAAFDQVEVGEVAVAVGVGGTFTSLAAVAMALDRYDRDEVHGARLDVDTVADQVTQLAAMSLDERRAIPSLDPARAPAILGGAIVALEAMRATEMDEVTVSEADILYGIALGLAK